MKGIIIYYNNKTAKQITDINNYLFGRVAIIKRNDKIIYYYYQGILHNISYYKLSKGCYFIYTDTNIDSSMFNTIIADIDIKEDSLTTAANYFRQIYEGKVVKNLGRN